MDKYFWNGECGNFTIRLKENKFKPGDPLQQDRVSMGVDIGTNIMILYTQHDEVSHLQVVNKKTGDVIEIDVRDWENEAAKLWADLSVNAKANILNSLSQGQKITAIKIIRNITWCDLKTAKRLIDSAFVCNIVAEFSKTPHAVDNGDGTGSLKGKLVGMGF